MISSAWRSDSLHSKRPNNPRDGIDLAEDAGLIDWNERLRHYWHLAKRLLARFWWIPLLTILLGGAYRGVQGIQKEPVFVSMASMHVSGRIALPDNVYREELSNFFGTQIDLMMSSDVQRRAHERVAMLHPNMEREWVRLRASQRAQTSNFALSAEGGSPEYTRAFLNAVMEEYQNLRREMRSATSETTLLALTEQLLRLEEEIDEQENLVVDFQRQNNLVFLQEQGNTAGTYLAQLKNNQAELRTQLLLLQSLQPGEEIETVTSSSEGRAQPVRMEGLDEYRATRAQLSSLRAEREEYATYLRPAHPKMVNYQLQIERLENLLRILEQQTRANLSERSELVRRQIRNLDAVIEQWETTALEISQKQAEFDRLNVRLDRSRRTYQRLLDSVQSINLNQQLEQETVGVLEPASPARAISVSVVDEVIEGCALGLVFGIALIGVIGFLDPKIRNAEDLKKRFAEPVLGMIPHETKKKNGTLKILQENDDRHRFAEACRTLRSSLLFMRGPKVEPPKRILITSAIPEDGKSTVSSNLAATFAFTKARVLLVDADMRRGNLYERFFKNGGQNPIGLYEYLKGSAELSDVILSSDYPTLDLIPAGRGTQISGELYLSEKMETILALAGDQYDYVIFDTPPILAVDDTANIAAKFEAILFTVRVDHTTPKQVGAAMESLAARQAPVSGFILNCADVRGADYYYQKDYAKYYSTKPKA